MHAVEETRLDFGSFKEKEMAEGRSECSPVWVHFELDVGKRKATCRLCGCQLSPVFFLPNNPCVPGRKRDALDANVEAFGRKCKGLGRFFRSSVKF